MPHEPIEPSAPVLRPASAEQVSRELAEAIARTETLGEAIVANLDGVERELEEIRRGPAFQKRPEP